MHPESVSRETLQATSRRQIKSFSVQQFFKNAAEVWASSPHLRSKLKLHRETKQKSKRKSEESQLPLKSKGCNEIQGFRGNCDSQASWGCAPALPNRIRVVSREPCFTWNTAFRENGLPHPAKGGSTPAFACQRAAIAPLPCLNLQPYFSSFNFIWIGQFQKMQLQQEKQIAKIICFANVGYSPTPRQHFWKIVGSKNFHLPAARFFERSISAKAMFHMKQIKNCS